MNEIEKYKPCKEAVEFRRQYATFKEAWEACPRGDWMLWIASRAGVDERTITLAKGLCAETVIHLMEDERSREAVRVAIAYGKGEATKEQLHAASYSADAAARADARAAAHADAASYCAVYAASYSSDAASYSSDAASDASYVTRAAARAASYAAAAVYAAVDAAYDDNQLKTANICREVLTGQVLKLIQ